MVGPEAITISVVVLGPSPPKSSLSVTTGILTEPSSLTVATSSVAVGVSFTGLTVTVIVAVSQSPSISQI